MYTRTNLYGIATYYLIIDSSHNNSQWLQGRDVARTTYLVSRYASLCVVAMLTWWSWCSIYKKKVSFFNSCKWLCFVTILLCKLQRRYLLRRICHFLFCYLTYICSIWQPLIEVMIVHWELKRILSTISTAF